MPFPTQTRARSDVYRREDHLGRNDPCRNPSVVQVERCLDLRNPAAPGDATSRALSVESIFRRECFKEQSGSLRGPDTATQDCIRQTPVGLPFRGEAFDVIYSSYLLDLLVLKYLPKVSGEFKRVLQPGGRIVLVNLIEKIPRS